MNLTNHKRFSWIEYHQLAELGFLYEDERLELINGQILQMAAKGTAHEACLTKLLRELPKLIGDIATLRCQSPVVLPFDGEVEPDFTIVRNKEDDYLNSYPYPEDVLLIIEISESSLTYDQEVKLPIYALSDIPDYWIFNVKNKKLDAYSEPYQDINGSFGYSVKRTFLHDSTISFPSFLEGSLDLSKVFPQFTR